MERNMMEVAEHQKLVREMEVQAEAKLAQYEAAEIARMTLCNDLRKELDTANERSEHERAARKLLEMELSTIREINISLLRKIMTLEKQAQSRCPRCGK